MQFQVLTTTSMGMAVFWDAVKLFWNVVQYLHATRRNIPENKYRMSLMYCGMRSLYASLLLKVICELILFQSQHSRQFATVWADNKSFRLNDLPLRGILWRKINKRNSWRWTMFLYFLSSIRGNVCYHWVHNWDFRFSGRRDEVWSLLGYSAV